MNITTIDGAVTLANGVHMPYLGLGVYKTKNGQEVRDAVTYALDAGYRHIDTAAAYYNEEGVGAAIASHPVARKDIFITTKVWNSDQGYDTTIRAFHDSLQRLGTDYLDLYLQHWPVKGKYKETWRAMETLYQEGKVRAIGVSNFLQFQLEDLMGNARVAPMVDQVEFHPFLQQPDLVAFAKANQIQFESWFPLMHGRAFGVEIFTRIAAKHQITIAQLLLRWNLQRGIVIIPKSVRQARIIENAQLFDFVLPQEDMEILNSLDEGARMGPDPANFNF
ncbi:aldo/keto reductase [Chitinophaga pinensis]|uniref:2,5-didehydrogluconate reductase n=1 Tax=Chitinophaga pinensis (strain ATCC 43595 / DSM 2588 / LMG 13176 / NBRC 15968 / NCIMB 11800 / UQM 2034) TaxID=485918 RepID=A0A979GB22_CHIPD|nr:aldo/keto reductase [Chitinophaga pinensis]ACU64125.1 2,5-didehydrogluconate reductase [Chitinophaga pinensis DSM 2588]